MEILKNVKEKLLIIITNEESKKRNEMEPFVSNYLKIVIKACI